MKRFIGLFCCVTLAGISLPSQAFLNLLPKLTPSEESMLISSMVVVLPSFIVVYPSMQLSEVVEARNRKDKMTDVKVKDKEGKEQTVTLPTEAVEKTQLQPGDMISLDPDENGVMLNKNGKPALFMIKPEKAELLKNEKLEP